jgi:hypothetical protein
MEQLLLITLLLFTERAGCLKLLILSTNPVCERRVDLLVCSLPLHRHSYIGFILAFASSFHNKQHSIFSSKHPLCPVGLRDPMHLCTSVSEEGGDGEGVGSEAPSLLSCTLRYVSLAELGTLCRVGFRDPMHLCTGVNEEGADGEGADSEATSVMSYTLRYVSLAELGTLCRVGLRDPMHLTTTILTFICTQVLWCLPCLDRSRASGVTMDPDIRFTILSTRATHSHYTDTNLYVFSLTLALPAIINHKGNTVTLPLLILT